MQAGFSRTGKNFGYEHYDIKPDLICCGKGMGGGTALSGVIGKKSIMDLPEVGNMSSTNSANPLSCSAGLAVLEEIKNKNLTKKAQQNGIILHKKLKNISQNYPNLFEVHGKGMIAALIFRKKIKNVEKKLRILVENCISDGLLLVYTGRESIKLGPPLTITKSAIIEGVDIIERNIRKVFYD